VKVLLGVHEASFAHEAGVGHPESPERLRAVVRGAESAGLGDLLVTFAPRAASAEEIERVHTQRYIHELEKFCREGGGRLDPDTAVTPASYQAANHGAGAGIDAVSRLRAGEASAAFLALRPPGHHALSERAMGFCLLNNIAITAAALVREGERVVIVDIDAHHGNGTQAAFYSDPRVLYISMHQYPLYPGSGELSEVGEAGASGCTINLPFPAKTTGDAYSLAFDEVVIPACERFGPTWLLVSAGFDAHREDPLTDLGLTAGDYAVMTQKLMDLSIPGRRIFFLEGGYHPLALERSVMATLAVLGASTFETETVSGSGSDGLRGATGEAGRIVDRARQLQERIFNS